ncbi:MAG TPA: hypothetical protein PLH11_00435 [Gemmobacter sp.]|nr:hypothetical protein [Gemmobacter sp.]
MNSDAYLVTGLVFVCLAVPSFLSARLDGRSPVVAAFCMLVAVTLIGLALWKKPGGYHLADVPMALFRVIGDLRMEFWHH